jgi:hypothetical protein
MPGLPEEADLDIVKIRPPQIDGEFGKSQICAAGHDGMPPLGESFAKW